MQRVWYRLATKSWYATFNDGGRQRQMRLLSGPKDRAHKQLAKQKLLDELKSRPDQPKHAPGWLTVRGVLKGFVRHSRKAHEPATAVWHSNLLGGFTSLFGRLPVSQLSRKHVLRWIRKSGYNPTSANRAIGALKRAFNWAVEEEYILKNPVAHVRKPKSLTRERILTAAERELILKSIRGPAFRDFVTGMTLTGCGPGEVARVRKEEVDLDLGVWILPKHKTRKQTGKPRVVYLCPEALELTKRLLLRCPADGPLFRNSRGLPWTGNAIRIRFRNLRQKHPQLKGVIAYTYRASFATDALEAGVPDATVASLLGHSNTDTLHRFYSRLSQKVEHWKEAAAKASGGARGVAPPGTAA